MTVGELEGKLTSTEYFGWISYFNSQTGEPEEKKPVNLLEDPDALLTGFGLK